jgi:hypothetical protein
VFGGQWGACRFAEPPDIAVVVITDYARIKDKPPPSAGKAQPSDTASTNAIESPLSCRLSVGRKQSHRGWGYQPGTSSSTPRRQEIRAWGPRKILRWGPTSIYCDYKQMRFNRRSLRRESSPIAWSSASSASSASSVSCVSCPGRPGHRAFFLGTRMEEAPHAPRVGVGAAPPPKQPPRPAGGSYCLGYHLGRAGGWQGPLEGPIN